jgi:1,4-dihydroxy-2-naphthoyl-CoA hydrolase
MMKLVDAIEQLNRDLLPFAKLLGIRFVSATPECVTAEMKVREDMCTRPAILHGGAMMALADTLGGCATSLNLRDGATTTTIESKTNFLAPAMVGSTVRAECVAVHRGRRTMVWQTRVTSENGKLLAIVTQTQMVLANEPKM